jgi:hypothetical protein
MLFQSINPISVRRILTQEQLQNQIPTKMPILETSFSTQSDRVVALKMTTIMVLVIIIA